MMGRVFAVARKICRACGDSLTFRGKCLQCGSPVATITSVLGLSK